MKKLKKTLKDYNIDKTWTLFLDRDGVINEKIENDYVKKVSEFVFIDGVVKALRGLNDIFGIIVIVTNQQGIGKKRYSEDDLSAIHAFMMEQINEGGGRIDEIYFSPDLASSGSNNRKPETGMALQAKSDFKQIEFEKSIIVGDSVSDIEFGKKLGMKTVFITSNNSNSEADINCGSLYEFYNQLI